MRWHIIRTLFLKEVQRQLANRGGLALAGLLIVAALLLTFFGTGDGRGGAFTGGVECCFIDYWRDDDWVEHLRRHVPEELEGRIRFRDIATVARPDERLSYPPATGAIQMRLAGGPPGRPATRICVWQPSPGSLALFEAWFWRESARYFQAQAATLAERQRTQTLAEAGSSSSAPAGIEQEHSLLEGAMDMRSTIASGLILFALFFSCVYLMPSLMCEERERGLLLAQALSPASPLEILAAKFLFYPLAGLALAGTLAGIAKPDVFREPIFWLTLPVAAIGSLSIGLTIASLARNQRAASMAALCYMLIVTLLLFICQQGKIPLLPYFALEYHCPRILHAALTHHVYWFYWANLIAATVLALGWTVLAAILFRKRGWQ
jgi:hypothetical protein